LRELPESFGIGEYVSGNFGNVFFFSEVVLGIAVVKEQKKPIFPDFVPADLLSILNLCFAYKAGDRPSMNFLADKLRSYQVWMLIP